MKHDCSMPQTIEMGQLTKHFTLDTQGFEVETSTWVVAITKIYFWNRKTISEILTIFNCEDNSIFCII